MKQLIVMLGILLMAGHCLAQGVVSTGGSASVVPPSGKTIKLKPTQLTVLTELDSAKKAFSDEVDRNKGIIATFNAMMQRSTSLNEQYKQAYDLILESWGYDPKKYTVFGGDLSKGELNVIEKPKK